MDEKKLFKYEGVLWESFDQFGDEYLGQNPLCPNGSCRIHLEQKYLGTEDTGRPIRGWHCFNCKKDYPSPVPDYSEIAKRANLVFQGKLKLNHKVYSLDLPPTKVVDEAEDENYWVQARISEKNGKRMAVIYFGERVKGKQNKKDYSQVFLDFEDEQMRFDIGNKNPMELLSKLEAEFKESKVVIKKK